MYIISKNKDYYDGVVGSTGVDKTIVYTREMVVDENKYGFPKPFTASKSWSHRRDNPFRNIMTGFPCKKESIYTENSPFIVGFCGKLYIGWKFYREVKNDKYSEPSLRTTITYDIEFIKKNLKYVGWKSNALDDINHISSYNSMEIFRNLNVPIFIHDHDYEKTRIHTYRCNEVFITNPLLKDYEFYKVMDSYTTLQEIQMFIGGVLGTKEKEIVEVEDKYKISQHGFDKFSFRRDKSNGKKRPQSQR